MFLSLNKVTGATCRVCARAAPTQSSLPIIQHHHHRYASSSRSLPLPPNTFNQRASPARSLPFSTNIAAQCASSARSFPPFPNTIQKRSSSTRRLSTFPDTAQKPAGSSVSPPDTHAMTFPTSKPISTMTRPHTQRMPSPVSLELVGQFGRRYHIEQILQDKGTSHRVYLANAENRKFILKDMTRDDIEYFREIYNDLLDCPYIRLAQDTIQEEAMFVYDYFTNDLLNLVDQQELPIAVTKRILRDTLRGLAALHDKDIVHADIKPNNILVQREENDWEMVVTQVQLADIENAARVPPGSDILDKQVGNRMWRSPEAHAKGPVNKPSDIFSFGIVCIYAILRRVIFAIDKAELSEGIDPLAITLQRQVSYFADEDGFNGLLKHLDNSPWCDVFYAVADGFDRSNPREPFRLWQAKGIDEEFRHLVCGLTRIDPTMRITAKQALAHPWFRDV